MRCIGECGTPHTPVWVCQCPTGHCGCPLPSDAEAAALRIHEGWPEEDTGA